jgi:hypothetical protein
MSAERMTIAGIDLPLRHTERGPMIDDMHAEVEPLAALVNMAIDRHLARFRALIEAGEPIDYKGVRAVPEAGGAYRISTSWLTQTVTLPAAALIEIMTTLTAMKLPPEPRVIPEVRELPPPPPPRVPPPRPDGLGTSWPELEQRAAELDRLVERERTEEHLAEEARLRCWLLWDLQDGCLFDRDEILPEDGELPTLRGYRAAAKQLAAYLESEERARYNPDAPETIMLGAPVSVDWFRRPQARVPRNFTPFEWLGYLENMLVRWNDLTGDHGKAFINAVAGGWWTLYWRTDDAVHPAIVAATTEGPG